MSTIALDKKKTACIVVDMQGGFLWDDGFMARFGLDITYLKKTVEPVRRVIQACRVAGVPIIFTRYILRPDYSDAGLFAEKFPGAKGEKAMFPDAFDTDIDERLKPQPDDFIVDKTRYSAFYCTHMDVILRGLGVDTVIICGVTTEICVESTIRDAFFRDFKIIMVTDAVAAVDPKRHEGTLQTIEYGFGTLVTTDQLADALK